jgi:hypothetical protein
MASWQIPLTENFSWLNKTKYKTYRETKANGSTIGM